MAYALDCSTDMDNILEYKKLQVAIFRRHTAHGGNFFKADNSAHMAEMDGF